VFSLLDPTDALPLPPRPLANGVFDAITHCIDQFLTGEENPLMAASWMATIKELVEIGPAVVKAEPPLELMAERSTWMLTTFGVLWILCPQLSTLSAIRTIFASRMECLGDSTLNVMVMDHDMTVVNIR
jgi:hypothetical protein